MITMFDDSHATIGQLQIFLDSSETISVTSHCPKKEQAEWMYKLLVRCKYRKLKRKAKGVLLRYIKRITQLNEKQIDRYVRAYKRGRKLCRAYERTSFPVFYTEADKQLLAETDNLHSPVHHRTSADVIQLICKREYEAGDSRYERLAAISVSHMYNLRETKRYQHFAITIQKTKTVQRSIGKRQKPRPNGRPGFLRVDSVHQGDFDGEKGVYHIDLVDEVTQWQVIISVEQISEKFLKPALKIALQCFPFRIEGFHTDNGSEYINEFVARLLRGMGIDQTKGRSRHCNDNALIESKNGSAVRKWWGYSFIHRSFASRLNTVNLQHLIPYLNFHHPCAFCVETVLPNGKRLKKYPHDQYRTPLDKFLSLKNPAQYLRPGMTLDALKKLATEETPNQAARTFQEARRNMLKISLDASVTMSRRP